MSELITVPCFNFSQGEVLEGAENAVTVCYYNNGQDGILIEIQQEGRYINFTSLATLKALVKETEKHFAKASQKLKP